MMSNKHWWLRATPALVVLFALVAIVACAPEAAEEAVEEPMEEPEAEVQTMELDAAILADPARPENEMAQDAERMPIEVYGFLGIEPGMTVADLWPGGGYNTFLLSKAVGDEGTVYSALDFYTQFREGAMATALRERVETDGLANVMVVDTIGEIPAGSVDVAIAVRNYHDVYGFGGDVAATVADIHAALAPGGVVGIVEVATDREGWDEETHRLNEQVVIDDFTAGGFELVESSDMLANPDDDHSISGFDEGRQTMDRYLLKFRKVEMADSGS